jgi:hypothetical protein
MTDCTERHMPELVAEIGREGQKGIAKEAQR